MRLNKGAFKNCSNLISFTFPDGIVSIGAHVFEDCTNLERPGIPDSIAYIGDDAFKGCEKISCEEYDGSHYMGNENNPYVVLLDIPDKTVSSFAFHKNTRLIGNGVFDGCENLTEITLPDGITGIGDRTFRNCGKLTEIILPDTLSRIGSEAFSGCASIGSITLGSGLDRIDDMAFRDCDQLIEIINNSSLGLTAGSDDHGAIAYRAKH